MYSLPKIYTEQLEDYPKGIVTYIQTERMEMKSLISNYTKFEDFEPEIKELYQSTLGCAISMQLFEFGVPYTLESFENFVVEQSRIWKNGYPFGGFIVTMNEGTNDSGKSMGYNFAKNINYEGACEIGGIGNYQFHKSGSRYQNLGYEAGCAVSLFFFTHKSYSTEEKS